MRRKLLSLVLVIVLCPMIVAAAAPPAFPGAEGFGVTATLGGRGGKVIEVTNLADSGTGSLRACVQATGPRTCVFKVGGTIVLSSALSISNSYITIAGQSAPGGGITIRASGSGDSIDVKTHDVILRYLSVRTGPGGENHAIEIASNGVTLYNIVIDHCSLSWGTDEVLETWYATYNVDMQWNIISEGLDCSTHSKGCHSKGVMLGGYAGSESKNSLGSKDIAFHHNLMAHNGERTPLVKTAGLTDVINNVIYNTYWTMSHVDMENQLTKVQANFIGNYYKYGPDSSGSYELKAIYPGSFGAEIFVQGNIGPHRTSNSYPEANIVDSGSRGYLVLSKMASPAITTTSALDAYNNVLADAGNSKGIDCNGNWYARRDAIDTRIVDSVKLGTGKIIDDPSDVGGWLSIAAGTPCSDSDHDGMPDSWESQRSLNPNDATDSSKDSDGDGYSNLEEYLSGASGSGSSPPVCTASDWSYTDGSCQPTNTLVRAWTNTNSNCQGGVIHIATETVACTYVLPVVAGDLNGDRKVDISDLVIVASNFGRKSGDAGFNSKFDVVANGVIDIGDLSFVAFRFTG